MIEIFSNMAFMVIKLDVLTYISLQNFSDCFLINKPLMLNLNVAFPFTTLLLSRFFSRGITSCEVSAHDPSSPFQD